MNPNNASNNPRMRLYYERKLWGVCVVCGKPYRNGETTLVCSNCLEKRRKQVGARRERVREQAREYRKRHKESGLCTFCNQPAVEGQSRCEFHKAYYLEENRAANKAKRERRNNAKNNQSQ